SDDESCGQVIDDFEQACSKLRIARRSNPEISPIDRYENEGVATLIDEALENIQPDTSAFANADEDFDFTNADAERLGTASPALSEPHNGSKKTSRPYRRMLAATAGWHRMRSGNAMATKGAGVADFIDNGILRSSVREPVITEVKKSLRVGSGQIFYLTRWSDNQLSWESPDAFSRYIDVLTKYESDQFARRRVDLVKQFRKAKQRGNMSVVTATPRRTNLERMVGSAVTNSFETARVASKSPAFLAASKSTSPLLKDRRHGSSGQSVVPPSSLFDLSTSNLQQKKKESDVAAARPGAVPRFGLFDDKGYKGDMNIDKSSADLKSEETEVVASGFILPQPLLPKKDGRRVLALDPEDAPLISTLP
ncbi:hypothetical protein LPJ56_006516, partial [Coemansia sp. RSA 2599]